MRGSTAVDPCLVPIAAQWAALVVRSDGTLLLAGTRYGGSQPVVFTVDRASGAPTATLAPPGNLSGTAVTDMTVDARGNLYLAGVRRAAARMSGLNPGARGIRVRASGGSA